MSTAEIPLAIQAPNITPPLQLEQQAEQLRAMQQEHGVRAQEMDLRDQQIKAAKLQNQINEQIVTGRAKAQAYLTAPDPAMEQYINSRTQDDNSPAPSSTAIPAAPPAAAQNGQQAGTSAIDLGVAEGVTAPPAMGTSALPSANPTPAATPGPGPAPVQRAAQVASPSMPSSNPYGALSSRLQKIASDPEIPYSVSNEIITHALGVQKAVAENAKLNTEEIERQNKRYVGIIDGVIQDATAMPDQANAIYRQGRARAVAEGLPDAQNLPADFPGLQSLVQQRHTHMIHADLLAESRELPKLLQDARAGASQSIQSVSDSPDPAAAYQAWRRRQDYRIQPELPEQWTGPNTVSVVKNLGLNPEQQLKAPGEAAKAQGEVDANNARILGSATGLLDYARKYDKLPDDQKASFRKPEDIEARGGWNKDVAKQILQVGETPSARQQRETAEMNAETARKREEQYATRTNMLENKAEDARKGQMKETTYWNLVKQHNDMEQKKNDLWRKNLEYGEIVDRSGYSDDPKDTQHKQPDGSMITDPETGRDVALTGERFKRFKGMQQKTKADAEAMEKDMKQIQQRLHGGEFADINQNTPSTTAATKTAPPTKASPRSVQKFSLPNGKVRIMVDGKSYEGTPDQADQLATKMNWTFGEKNQGK